WHGNHSSDYEENYNKDYSNPIIYQDTVKIGLPTAGLCLLNPENITSSPVKRICLYIKPESDQLDQQGGLNGRIFKYADNVTTIILDLRNSKPSVTLAKVKEDYTSQLNNDDYRSYPEFGFDNDYNIYGPNDPPPYRRKRNTAQTQSATEQWNMNKRIPPSFAPGKGDITGSFIRL
ncbi:unnamed protein product, partial [Meganyctiphanes norvegica]